MRTTVIGGRTVRLRGLRFDGQYACAKCGHRAWRRVTYVVSRRQRTASWPRRFAGEGHTTVTVAVCARCGCTERASYLASIFETVRRLPCPPPEPLHPGLAARKHDPERAERRARQHREHQGKGRR